MTPLFEALAEEARTWSVAEIVAVVMAVMYLLLAIRQNIWCWLCALISAALFVNVFLHANLYMESVLNAFYFGVAIYGWRLWSRGLDATHELPVTTWEAGTHVSAIGAIIVVSMATGYVLDTWTVAAYPYIDSLTTWGAIWTTFLVARKVLENWWYWLIIDAASIYIYWQRDLALTALLFVVYVIMIPFGLLAWTRSRRVAA